MAYTKAKHKRRDRRTIRKMKPQYGNMVSKNRKRHGCAHVDMTHYSKGAAFILTRCRGKSLYRNKDEAIAGAVAASRLIGACRIYKCPICGYYHLTTQIENLEEAIDT